MMYHYIHKDGTTGSSDSGAWFAIKNALGEEIATKLVSESQLSQYNYFKHEGLGTKMRASLIVHENVVGFIYK